jgi:hypothetical protein
MITAGLPQVAAWRAKEYDQSAVDLDFAKDQLKLVLSGCWFPGPFRPLT